MSTCFGLRAGDTVAASSMRRHSVYRRHIGPDTVLDDLNNVFMYPFYLSPVAAVYVRLKYSAQRVKATAGLVKHGRLACMALRQAPVGAAD